MKTLKIIGAVIGIIIVLFLLIAMILPKSVHIEDSIEIKATSDIVSEQVNNLSNWTKWSPFQDTLNEMKTSYEGPEEGVGAIMKWESKKEGNGKLTNIEVKPGINIKSELNMNDNGRSIVNWDFKPTINGTMVVWGIDVMDLHYPFGRWMGLLMRRMMHTSFQKGLKSLKILCESGDISLMKKWKISKVFEKEVAPILAVTIKDSSTVDRFAEKFEEIFGTINTYMKTMKVEQTGPPFCIYYTWNPEGITSFEAGIPINKKIAGKARILFTEFPGRKVVMTSLYGAYEYGGYAHDAINKYMKEKNKICSGAPWEVYITDPANEPDTTKWETQIYYPVQ